MADTDIDKGREAARKAMSAGRAQPSTEPTTPRAATTDSDKRGEEEALAKARFTMAKDRKQSIEFQEIEKKRIEAAKAMEGAERRAKREAEEQHIAAEIEREREIEEVKRRRLIMAKQQTIQKAEAEKTAAKTAEAEGDAYREKVEEAKKSVESITSRPATLPPFHSLATDLQTTATKEALSAAEIALKAREEMLRREKIEVTDKKKSTALAAVAWFMALVIIAAGVGLVAFASYRTIQQRIQVEVPATFGLVSSDEVVQINVDGLTPTDIANRVKEAARPRSGSERLIEIYFVRTVTDAEGTEAIVTIGAPDFLAVSNTVLPDSFTYFLNNRFAVAAYTNELDTSLAYAFTTRSFPHTFETLLQNESQIASALFKSYLEPTDRDLLLFRQFEDAIISNLDVRLVRDMEDQIIILYAFVDQETLIFAQSERALLKMVESLKRARLKAGAAGA